MTEDEAKTKWCPFARFVAGGDDAAANRWKQSLPANEPDALNPIPCRCLGSTCMAWRWDEREWINDHTPASKGKPISGHCGLAGRSDR